MNVLVVAAHPDDEILGCGGTMAKLARAGHNVSIAILAEGITSRGAQADFRQVERLHQESQQVADYIGAKRLILKSFPDNKMDTVPLLDIVKTVEAIIDEVQAETLYVQHGGDLNIDHVNVFRAVLTATRPIPGSRVTDVYAYEVGSSTEWAFQSFAPVFRPSVFVDISDSLEEKVTAMSMYSSEIRAFPHPRSAQAIQAAAYHWGAVAGLSAAEPFELIRSIRL